MIFTDEIDEAAPTVRELADKIAHQGFNRRNFAAYYERFRKNYGSDDALAAGYLALRGIDPCDYDLSAYCIWSGTTVNAH